MVILIVLLFSFNQFRALNYQIPIVIFKKCINIARSSFTD